MVKWYQIRVTHAELTASQTHMYFYQIHKNELYVSPHVKLAGNTNVAQISDKAIAEIFLDKCLPIFKRRYGANTELVIDEWETGLLDKALLNRLTKDTQIIKLRIEQENFSPNKKVTSYPIDKKE